MTLTYDYLHKLFNPYDTWEEYRLQAITEIQKLEWTKNLVDYQICCRRAVRSEIQAYCHKIEAEIRDYQLLQEKRTR